MQCNKHLHIYKTLTIMINMCVYSLCLHLVSQNWFDMIVWDWSFIGYFGLFVCNNIVEPPSSNSLICDQQHLWCW